MTSLVACLSTGKGTWGHVSRLINDQEWDSVILITNEFGKENFKPEKQGIELVIINTNAPVKELVEQIKNILKEKIKDTEIAVNLVSGSGKEHMAILSAVMKAGFGFRLVALTKEGIKEV